MNPVLAMVHRSPFRPAAQKVKSTVAHGLDFDTVSELPNRISLDWFLEYLFAMRSERPLTGALFVIDLNQARAMRCAFGEHIYNRFIFMISERFRRAVKSGQLVSVIGEGEYVFVAPFCEDNNAISEMANELMAMACKPVLIDGREYSSLANIGVSLLADGHETPVEVLRFAQAVLIAARAEGHSTTRFAHNESLAHASAALEMLNEVRQARRRGEFYLEYQPTVNLLTGEILSVEALLRWKSAKFGTVMPDQFIGLLEHCGAIHEAGAWVLRRACEQAARWNTQSLTSRLVAVNVSAIQLQSASFVDDLKSILADTGCQACWLELEITETTAASAIAGINERLHAIAELGVKLAIDDFGAGYSSFGTLSKLPVHHLKLDRALIADLPVDRKSAIILRSMLGLATELGMTLTVEGIERQDQQEFCKQAGFQQAQGFLFARPSSAEGIDGWVNRSAA